MDSCGFANYIEWHRYFPAVWSCLVADMNEVTMDTAVTTLYGSILLVSQIFYRGLELSRRSIWMKWRWVILQYSHTTKTVNAKGVDSLTDTVVLPAMLDINADSVRSLHHDDR